MSAENFAFFKKVKKIKERENMDTCYLGGENYDLSAKCVKSSPKLLFQGT